GQAPVAVVKPAADEITNHGREFVEILSLGRHFRLMAGRHQHVVILFDLKHELFLHAVIVPHYEGDGKSGLRCPLYPIVSPETQIEPKRISYPPPTSDGGRRVSRQRTVAAAVSSIAALRR